MPSLAITATPDWRLEPPAPDAEIAALTARVTERVERLSAWRPYVTRAIFTERPGVTADAQALIHERRWTRLSGPSARITAFALPADGSIPTPPGDVTWDATADIEPHELLAVATLSAERETDAFPITDIRDGRVSADTIPIGPVLAQHLADAIVRADSTAFAAGAGTNADPFSGIALWPGIGSTGGTERALAFGDLQDAYWDLVGAGRFPSVCWVSPGAARDLRSEKDAEGNLRFPPNEALVLDVAIEPDGTKRVVPIVPLYGLPDGALLAEGAKIVAVHRTFGGRMFEIARSTQQRFDRHQVIWRVKGAVDFGVIPGSEDAVVRVRGAN